MRFSKLIQAGILLALCCVLPAHGAGSCSEAAQSEWLTSCGWALYEVRLAEVPPPRDPWEIMSDVFFKAHAELSDELVDACEALVAEPDRIPAKTALVLWPSGWPPLADRCTRNEHLQWLRSCEDDALALPGLTRTDLLVAFREEGGISTYADRTFVHRRCGNLKVRVHFSLTDEVAESPSDVIETISAYVGGEMTD